VIYPADLRYTAQHEWARLEDGSATVGITSYACSELSDIVYVDLPTEGSRLSVGDAVATLESVKAVSDVYAPVSGTVDAVNTRLREEPGLINADPYGAGWIARIRLDAQSTVEGLMNSAAYADFLRAEKGA